VTRVTARGRPGRLDAVLAEAAGVSRADAQRAIEAGAVLVDGVPRPKAHRLSGGERIEADLPETEELEPEQGEVPVRFEDEHVLVIAKPAGIVTHPTASRRSGTLVNRLLGMGVALSQGSDPDRPGIVHRLDAGTSGLMLVAKTDEAHEALVRLLAAREVEREYLALVRGAVPHDDFAVDAPLERRGTRVRVRRGGGAEAETAFSVAERLERETLLVARPRTGRTHQIPGPPLLDRPSDPRGPGLRRGRRRREAAGADEAVPPRPAAQPGPSDHRGAARGRGAAARGPPGRPGASAATLIERSGPVGIVGLVPP